MPSRTMTRIAAAGLLIAAVCSARPALGQCPDEGCCESARKGNPWRGVAANPWRGQAEAAPAPRAGDCEQVFSFYVGLFGGDAAPAAPCPQSANADVQIPNLTWTYSYQIPAPTTAYQGAGIELRTGPFTICGSINGNGGVCGTAP